MIKHLLRIVASVHSEEPETAIKDNVVEHCQPGKNMEPMEAATITPRPQPRYGPHDRNCPSGATAATAESDPTITPVTTAAC